MMIVAGEVLILSALVVLFAWSNREAAKRMDRYVQALDRNTAATHEHAYLMGKHERLLRQMAENTDLLEVLEVEARETRKALTNHDT